MDLDPSTFNRFLPNMQIKCTRVINVRSFCDIFRGRTWCNMRAPTDTGASSPPSISARAKDETPAASQRFDATATSVARSSFHLACSRRLKPSCKQHGDIAHACVGAQKYGAWTWRCGPMGKFYPLSERSRLPSLPWWMPLPASSSSTSVPSLCYLNNPKYIR